MEPVQNPFAPFFDEMRRIIREELASKAGGNGSEQSPALLSAEAAARLFDVPQTWISEAARRGELPSVKLGHYVRFRVQDLKAFVDIRIQGKL